MTEEHDRSLTDIRSSYDPTEAFLCYNDMRSESNMYAIAVKNKIMKEYCVPWEGIQNRMDIRIRTKCCNYTPRLDKNN